MGEDAILQRDTLAVPVTIRLCRETDLPALEWFGEFTPHREIIRRTFATQARGDGSMVLADVNGFPAGQVWIDYERKRHLRRATIWAVRVFPAFRRCGIGTRLMLAAERLVTARGVDEIELGIDRDNLGVIHFYERLGYEPSGTERGTYSYRTPDGRTVDVAIDQILLHKRLNDRHTRHAAQ
ncbi:GNAT family N-acetyltransferase [Azospirillum halopraeferens]|uniref:GNAT family N-acetyltransferase n=1 Tax=Azospirillum halopraeferens TaxID=34010 RepID=UPI000401C3BB|nr:GNAT family N-acetyltransferase [Azospirillum halopraeferens]